MPRNDNDSLNDEATLQGGKEKPAVDPSLSDHSTFSGGEDSSLDGQHVQPDRHIRIVDLGSRYEIHETLGKGGMGEVLLASDTMLGRKVAIKRIIGNAASSTTAAARFLTEAKSVAALNHPCVVQIHDFGRDAQGPFLIMEYVSGGTLLDRCKQGPIAIEEAINLTCRLCDGISCAHSAGIIHRDIKPANILLTEDGVPKLTDFGLAKAETRDHTITIAGAVLGTLDFMPPEQRQDAALADSRSDIWSLAATLYQMVTGKSPKIIRFDLLPPSLTSVLGKALEESKDDRYQSASELRDDLRKSLTETNALDSASVGLNAGECPSCHKLNEPNRKFCSSCGDSLRVKCLSCDAEIAVWEKFCGECGSNQEILLATRNTDYKDMQTRATVLRQEYQFTECLELASKLTTLDEDHFLAFKDWGAKFAAEVESEREQLNVQTETHFGEARKHRESFDYPAAIHAMERIPEPLRSAPIRKYFDTIVSEQDESKSLMAEIKTSIANRTFEGLLPKVERGLELRGDRKDLLELRSQLIAREQKLQILEKQRDEAYEAAANLLAKGDAKAAIARTNAVKMKTILPSQQELKERLNELVAAERALAQLVSDCKVDGAIGPAGVCKLLLAVTYYLELNPHHPKIAQTCNDLLSRLARNPASHSEFLSRALADMILRSKAIEIPDPVLNLANRKLEQPIIGIDVGMTNSVVAVMEGNTPKLIPNQEGKVSTPSMVAFTDQQDAIVGEAACRQAITNPTRTVASAKRFIGRRRQELGPDKNTASHGISGASHEYVKIEVGEKHYSPQEVSAKVLRKLKEAAHEYLGYWVNDAVISVPAYFNDSQRNATMDAAELAGLDVTRMINNPVATALAYGFNKNKDEAIMVLDLGGGSFDVAVIEIADTGNVGSGDAEPVCHVFQVLSYSGDTNLGGVDFDAVLLNYVADDFMRQHAVDLRDDAMTFQCLQEACEIAKKDLSSLPETQINLPHISGADGTSTGLTMKITRSKFEELVHPLIERCRQPILTALEDAFFAVSDIDEIILVGGSSRIPKVRELVKSIFGKDPHQGVNSEEVVAVGAALQGSILAGERTDMLVLDATPFRLGIETDGGVMTALVERNTTIPVEKEHVFSTVIDDQTGVNIRVFEGEHDMVSHNRLLADFNLEGLPPQPRGVGQIRVKFDVETNGVVSVSAKDLNSGQKASVMLNGSAALSQAEGEPPPRQYPTLNP